MLAAALRIFGSIAGALLPKAKQIYAERSAAQAPEASSTDGTDKIFDDALNRLGGINQEEAWWKSILVGVSGYAIQPDWFKKPHVQRWLSQPDIRRLLKDLARANLIGAAANPDSHEALIASYIATALESRQHAESIITFIVAVLKASVSGSVRDPGTAAIVQATNAGQRDLLLAMEERLDALEPADLETLTQLAHNYANLIPDDIGGTQLDRGKLIDTVDAKLEVARLVQVRGLPGSGKSVLIKRLVKRALAIGPALFLKAEQLEGTSWISYATSQGLSSTPLEQLLAEIGVTGTPILFIDAIDRVEKEQQPIILDVLHTIAQSPRLEDWRVVVSLRDTGIEVLRNWLGNAIGALAIETVGLEQLSDEEAQILAAAKPHLKPLLFGSSQVRDIVRRPFFAKVLDQSYTADPSLLEFVPQSEVDLLENWWRRGGYNETGQDAIERRRTLLDLARIRARQLSQPINLGQVSSVAHIDDLRSDGILQHAREDVSVRFAHDIFFEWAFFHVLADRGNQWIEEIKACGEPPAVARAVELASQWEYTKGSEWQTHLALTEASNIRTQWLRAWLVGPVGTHEFDMHEGEFAEAVFASDFRLFRKTLVWFQAEKTAPNPAILSGTLPEEQRQRFAHLLGWPSDFAAWRRLIEFTLRNLPFIPQRLYPECVAIFEVWQNALADHTNSTSQAILGQCAEWLSAIGRTSDTSFTDEKSGNWQNVPDLGTFEKSLETLILRASQAEPSFAADYLKRVIGTDRIRDTDFNHIISLSPILAKSHPALVVQLSLAFSCRELPDDKVARKERERRERSQRRKAIQAKPEAERTRQEKMALASTSSLMLGDSVSSHDWRRLSINDSPTAFSPPSPLREPFHSLFKSSPDDALHLLNGLCNHAITAWRQLHSQPSDRRGTPLPLELVFPWGKQSFWGSEREYLWCRSTWAPAIIGCGFLALEKWCIAELQLGRSVDELIRRIVEGNACIAILGTAATLALQTNVTSEFTMPLFSSQRLMAADQTRMAQDISSAARVMGFRGAIDALHIEAIKAADALPARKTQLSWLIPGFVFAPDTISERIRNAIGDFKNNLPFQYEEQRDNPEEQEHLTAQALRFAELVDPNNYQAYRTEEGSEQIALVHVSPSAKNPENVAKLEQTSKYLQLTSLWHWASNSFDKGAIQEAFTINDAIALAKNAYVGDLFEHPNAKHDEDDEIQLGMLRGAVAATAAIALCFRQESSRPDVEWARQVLVRAANFPERPGPMWSPNSDIPWHSAKYAARGFAADLREGTASPDGQRDLLKLVAHPLQAVSLAALDQACKLWANDPKLAWAALTLALSLCHVPPHPEDQYRSHYQPFHSPAEAQAAVDAALAMYKRESGWDLLPLPPPAWIKVEHTEHGRSRHYHEEFDDTDAVDAEEWDEPEVFWNSQYAGEILKLMPLEQIFNSGAKCALLDFLTSALDWTNQKNSPPWHPPGSQDRSGTNIFEWTHDIGSTLGKAAGLLTLNEYQARFLKPIFELEDAACWDLLTPFASYFVCTNVYDAPVVTADALSTLGLCLERLLEDSAFKRGSYRAGKLSGFAQPDLVKTLMMVSVDHADMAVRYVNGDWAEVGLILPLIDRFVRTSGWAASIMSPYIMLCERAKSSYPAEDFADQVLAVIGDGPEGLKDWQGTFIPARIAELVQHFSHRDAPMNQRLAQKFLKILDLLVDMGDRRSAGLQLSEAFRETRLPS